MACFRFLTFSSHRCAKRTPQQRVGEGVRVEALRPHDVLIVGRHAVRRRCVDVAVVPDHAVLQRRRIADSAAAQLGGADDRVCKETPRLSQLFLCSSGACLGKMITFSTKWRKEGVF